VGGVTTVSQQVSVTGGKKYSLRFFYHTAGLRADVKEAVPTRGRSRLVTKLQWVGGHGASGAADTTNGRIFFVKAEGSILDILDVHKDPDGWARCFDERMPNWYAPRPYLAPPGATAVVISFSLEVLATDNQPSAFIDDVEFVQDDGK
ncbi:MAG: hypothetical protein WCI73_20590, partial [Phycisphaerae bacterium]